MTTWDAVNNGINYQAQLMQDFWTINSMYIYIHINIHTTSHHCWESYTHKKVQAKCQSWWGMEFLGKFLVFFLIERIIVIWEECELRWEPSFVCFVLLHASSCRSSAWLNLFSLSNLAINRFFEGFIYINTLVFHGRFATFSIQQLWLDTVLLSGSKPERLGTPIQPFRFFILEIQRSNNRNFGSQFWEGKS